MFTFYLSSSSASSSSSITSVIGPSEHIHETNLESHEANHGAGANADLSSMVRSFPGPVPNHFLKSYKTEKTRSRQSYCQDVNVAGPRQEVSNGFTTESLAEKALAGKPKHKDDDRPESIKFDVEAKSATPLSQTSKPCQHIVYQAREFEDWVFEVSSRRRDRLGLRNQGVPSPPPDCALPELPVDRTCINITTTRMDVMNAASLTNNWTRPPR